MTMPECSVTGYQRQYHWTMALKVTQCIQQTNTDIDFICQMGGEGATLKAGMTERRNDGMAESRNGGKLPQILKDGIVESRNGGKYPQILKDRIAESRNGGKYPQILKDRMTENHPKS